MKIRLSSLLSLVSAVLLAGTIACAGLTFWAVLRTAKIDERIALAQASYAEHAILKANLYHLFKEMADALLIGGRDRSGLETEIKAAIEANLIEIQKIIGLEIELDAKEELEELELLGKLDRNIRHVIAHYEQFLLAPVASDLAEVQEYVHLLDQDIDHDLSNLIDLALAGELEEVALATQSASDFRNLVTWLTSGILAFIVLGMLAAFSTYRRTVMRPLAELVTGADAYRRGNYDAPIRAAGAMELRQLANTLSGMAAEIAYRERQLRGEARLLETRVNERTSELQTILTRFEQFEASRRQMMADVSHELRTPLTIIQGEADIALRAGQIDQDTASESFARIREAARHTSRIVDDLLLVAREEAGQLRLDLRSVDLDAALADAASLAQSKVEVLRLGTPAQVRVDPLRLRQCLLAVMNNALRYGGRLVRAKVESRGDEFHIVIEDDGPGLSDSEKDQAFDRFFRGSGVLSSGIEGTGLGLPIVRSIMAAHGGSVELADRAGGGLVVRLIFASPVRSIVSPSGKISARKAE